MSLYPVWLHLLFGAVLFLFVVQPWSFRFGALPLQVVLVWVVSAWLVVSRFALIRTFLRAHGAFVLTLIAVIVLSVLFRTVLDGSGYKRLLQLLTGILLCFVTLVLIKDEKNRKYFFYPLLVAASLSAFVAVGQSLGQFKFTWSHTVYHLSPIKIPSGLESFPVALSYSVVGIAVLALTLGIYNLRNRSSRVRLFYPMISLISGFLILAGVYVSESRSGMLGIIVGCLASVILLKKTRKKYINLSVIFGLAIFIVAVSLVVNLGVLKRTQVGFDKALQDSRLVGTWSYFLPVIIENPLGVPGYGNESQVSQVNITNKATVGDALRDNRGYDPHNFILTTMLFYGIPAGLSLLFLYLSVIYKGMSSAYKNLRKTDIINLNTVLLLLLVAANVSLMVHAWFHNANLVVGEMRGWFWIGAVLGLSYYSRTNYAK